jgi:hypothetical protein
MSSCRCIGRRPQETCSDVERFVEHWSLYVSRADEAMLREVGIRAEVGVIEWPVERFDDDD